MRTQANWNLGDLRLPEGDPMQEIAQLKSSAKLIDVDRDVPEIYEEFRVMIERESRLSSLSGVECNLKWTADGGRKNPCDDCSHSTTNTEDPLSVLCRLGRRQNALIDEMDAVTAAGRLDDALMAAYEADSAFVEDAVFALG